MVNRILYPALWKAYACYLNPLSLCCCDPRKPEARTKKALDLKIKTNKQKQTLLTTTAKKKKKTLKLLCFPAKFTKSHWSSLWTSFPNFSLSKAFSVSCLWRFKKILESILVSLYKKKSPGITKQHTNMFFFIITWFPYKPTSGFTSNMVPYQSDSSNFCQLSKLYYIIDYL